jgi:hypothetical protein
LEQNVGVYLLFMTQLAADLEGERKVSKDDGLALATRYRCKFVGIFWFEKS